TSLNGPQDLRLITDVPVPAPGPGDVLIRVTAAGVNFGDISQAHGAFPGGPVIGAGIGCGAFAEYTTLPAIAVIPVPTGWAEQEAMGLLVNWPTALAALRPLGRIAAGQTVLIHAAAGGTGQAAVRMARHYGAMVIATASPGKHETVRALGADHVLDSRAPDLAAEVLRLTGGAGADLVLESGGGAMLGASLAAARRVTGRVVVYGMAGGEAAVSNWELVYRHQVQVTGLNIGVLIQAAPQVFGEVMGELFAFIAAGVLAPGKPAVYELADGPKALAELESRATAGKLALLP